MKLSRRQLRKLILEEIGPDKMVKPDRNMSKEEEVIADDENELTLFKLANYIQKGSNAATGKLKVYHDGDPIKMK